MPRDLSHLLHDTAECPSQPLDVGGVKARARRRRLVRRGSGTTAAVAVLSVAAVLVTGLSEPDNDVDLVDDPPPPTVEESDTDGTDDTGGPSDDEAAKPDDVGEFGPELSTHDVRGLPEEGVAVETDGQIVLLSLDTPAEVLGHLPGKLDPHAEGLSSPASGPLPLRLSHHGSTRWVDPASGRTWEQHSKGAPVGADTRVMLDTAAEPEERMLLLRDAGPLAEGDEPETLAAWPEEAPWWLTPDHRVVSWATCADGDCPHRYHDTETGEEGELDPGCWVAAVGGEGAAQICETGRGQWPSGGRQLRLSGDGSAALDAPNGLDDEPATAAAVFPDGVVRVDHATCDRVEPFQLTGGELGHLREGFRDGFPTAVPLGVAADGRVVLHSNASDEDCGVQADQPGIRLHDPANGTSELVWDVEAPVDAARMWSSPEALTAAASQPADSAERDGVVPELAALPIALRLSRPADGEQALASTPEGVWLAARPHRDVHDLTDGCGLGDADGMYGRDIVCVMEYGELLLLDSDTERVERAYPLPQVPPQWIEVTDEAVYCGRQGDGGLPTSMLCRVDRETGETTVRVFTHDGPSPPITEEIDDYIEHAGWVVDESTPGGRFYEADATDEGLVIEGHDGRALVDPETLELTLDP